jgi:hypothetical protein
MAIISQAKLIMPKLSYAKLFMAKLNYIIYGLKN